MIVALNDDDLSTAPPVGTMSAYLSRLISSRRFLSRRKMMAGPARRVSRRLKRAVNAPHIVEAALAAPGNDGTLSKPSLARTI